MKSCVLLAVLALSGCAVPTQVSQKPNIEPVRVSNQSTRTEIKHTRTSISETRTKIKESAETSQTQLGNLDVVQKDFDKLLGK